MNDRELRVARRYRLDGWEVLRNGAPDFFLRRGRRLIAVEVKSPTDALRPEQEEVRRALMSAGIEYRIERPDRNHRFTAEELAAEEECRERVIRSIPSVMPKLEVLRT